ncbi:hypothetical protein FGG08_004044 [Glutinoglossum americanum]|uniref:ribose-phosphate diphosphokinase n=1 Tax=Glutinoglossum americanum TaxID=1670608 RepID=A0A9P8I1G1_9PEZI|nr:hypothetical protein FGG08_004044 [Glutinoglossum americanum]
MAIAVMPYFPYSRQSKKKSHRGAITARMLANLLTVAGVDHIVTVDLHASQMQGFFGKPVDNLHAEPLIARWIRHNVSRWQEAVVVSKNPGGTKRVTSLADALKLNFGIVTTDKRRFRPASVSSSVVLDRLGVDRIGGEANGVDEEVLEPEASTHPSDTDRDGITLSYRRRREESGSAGRERTVVPSERLPGPLTNGNSNPSTTNLSHRHRASSSTLHSGSPTPSPLARSTRVSSFSNQVSTSPPPLRSATTSPSNPQGAVEDPTDEYTDERAREVITGRLIQGHIVDDDYPSPTISAMSGSNAALPERSHGRSESVDEDSMTQSIISTTSSFMLSQQPEHALGGTFDATASSDEEEEGLKNPELEQMITLVGNVRGRTVFIVDDMIDKPGSWIAAAECVVKRGGAKRVFCIATHGLFGDDCLAQMEAHECIDYIVVTNTFPIPPEKLRRVKKLVVLDVSNLLAEAIRRNHYGQQGFVSQEPPQ